MGSPLTFLPQSSMNPFSSLGDSSLTRGRLIQGSGAVLLQISIAPFAKAELAPQQLAGKGPPEETPYSPVVLPPGIRSRFVHNINAIRMHVLEAGFEEKGRLAVVLLHGFPELAYSWRKVMLPLARAGFHVIARDRRGYGRTSGWDVRYDDNPGPFATLKSGA
jgi:pimeloyl-ACP methyl ester carboxylesterase